MPRTRTAAIAAATVVAGLVTAPAQARPQPDFSTTRAVGSAAIREAIKQTKTTSVSIAMLSDGKVVWSQGFGRITPGGKRPTPATTYGIGSVSKTVTAVAVMQLVDKGKVSLDAPVVKYIPDFAMLSPQYAQITVRMLLNHSAGLPGSDYANGQSFEKPIPGYPQQVLSSLGTSRLKTTPGAMSVYCNDCFTLAGEVVARVSGMSFEEYAQANIFKPLGMTKTGFVVNDQSAPLIVDGEVMPRVHTNVAAAGGVVSTPTDMLKLARVFTGERSGILSQAAIMQMGSDQTASTLKVGPRSELRYGLGWDTVSAPPLADVGVTAWVKGGDIPPHHSTLVVAPDQDLAVTVSGSGLETSSSALEVIAEKVLLTALVEKGVIKRYPKPVSGQPGSAGADVQKVKRMTGIYLGAGMSVRVTRITAKAVALWLYADGQWVKRPGRYVLRADGGFWSTEVPGTSIRTTKGWGRRYVVLQHVAGTANTYTSMALGQKMRPGRTLPAWAGRVKQRWLLANEHPLSLAWATPQMIFTRIPGLSGYLMASGVLVESVPFNASETPDLGSMFLQVPLMAGRDLYDFNIVQHGGEDVLMFASSVLRQEATVPDLAVGTVTIGSRGFVEWAKAPADMTVALSGQSHWKVFDDGLEQVDSGGNATASVTLKAGQYVALFGAPGTAIAVG